MRLWLAMTAILVVGCGGGSDLSDLPDGTGRSDISDISDISDRAGRSDVSDISDLSDDARPDQSDLPDPGGSEELALSDSEGSEELALSDSEGSDLFDAAEASDPSSPPNTPPALTAPPLAEPVTGTVPVAFSLLDAQSDVCGVDVYYRVGWSTDWVPATLWAGSEAPDGLASSPEGVAHTVLWNTMKDLGKEEVAEVRLNLVPHDAGGPGTAAELGPFVVTNGPFQLADETADRLPELTGDSRYVAHADFDGDGDEDLALAVAFAPNLLLLNDGAGHFSAEELPGGSFETTCMETLDVDGDSWPDLFVANANQPSLVLRNLGDGTFEDVTEEALGPFSYQVERVLPGDFDADGDHDLLFITSGSQQKRLLLNDGKAYFDDVTATHMPEDSLMGSSGSTGSVDGEGPPDLVFAAFISSQTTRLYLNDGTAHFTDKSEQIEPAFESIGFDALLIDLDNDGDLDLFEANLWNRQRILINNGQGSLIEYKFAVPTDIGPYMDGTVMAADAAGGDVDLDGNNDVFVACSGTTPQANQDLLLLGNGNGTVKLFSPAPFPVDGGDSRHAALVDLDHDGDLDLVVVNSLSQTMVYWNQ